MHNLFVLFPFRHINGAMCLLPLLILKALLQAIKKVQLLFLHFEFLKNEQLVI